MSHTDLSFHVAKALLESATKAETEPHELVRKLPPVFTIAISREVGAQGGVVAREVGQLLGWPVHDQGILDKVSEELKRPSFLLQRLDERPANWLDTIIAGIASDYHVSPSAYLKYLVGVVRGLGKIGHCVVVGRGAAHILPAESTLRVRAIASTAERLRVVSQRTNLSGREAARWMEQTEQARLEFIRSHFGVDTTDPHHYDLVVNTSRLPIAECARIIVDVLRQFEWRSANS